MTVELLLLGAEQDNGAMTDIMLLLLMGGRKGAATGGDRRSSVITSVAWNTLPEMDCMRARGLGGVVGGWPIVARRP
jgi:hypothetical protein